MPDENRFSGLGDAVGDQRDEPKDDSAPEPNEDPEDPTAFGFEDTVQKSIYVRPDAYDELEDAEALVNARLRTEHEVRNLARREFFDAALRVAAEHDDELVERIIEEREE